MLRRPALPTMAETTMSTSGSAANWATASGPTSNSTSGRQRRPILPRGRRRVGDGDPPRTDGLGLPQQQFGVAVGRKRHRPQPPLGSGDHLQRAATDAPGRAQHGDILGGWSLWSMCNGPREWPTREL